MIDARSIAWQATEKLCGPLDLETALDDFFRFLRGVMPLSHIVVGKFSENPPTCRVLAFVAESGVRRLDKAYDLTSAQVEIARKHRYFDARGASRLFIPDGNHPLAPLVYFPHSDLADLPPWPCLQFRITDTREFLGGISFVFQPGEAISDDMLNILDLLNAPLQTFVNASFRYAELEKIRDNIARENRRLRKRLAGVGNLPIIGASGGLKKLMENVRQVAPLEVSVLLRGETGTGKELVAKTLHQLSPRAGGPFVAVNCGAIPPSLIDSELFGHAKGAFTGANAAHKGRFEQAHGGTLFLDEVAELPLHVQARLLRVLQERAVDRVGGTRPTPVDFRLIAATHRPLEQMVEAGTLREDLYYRLNVVTLRLPPLRERRQDIPLLVEHFLEQTANRFGVKVPRVPDGEMERLARYDWPGNVRELQNMTEEALAVCRQGDLRFRLGHEDGRGEASADPVRSRLRAEEGAESFPSFDEMMKDYLARALRRCGGRIQGPGGAAELLGLNHGTLRSKLDRYGVPHGRAFGEACRKDRN